MSSKLYKKYISLKIEDDSYFYLFKSGIFYIFISDDARLLSPILDLKLTNLTPVIKKCGFPENSYDKYFRRINELNLKVKVITLDDRLSNMTIDKHFDIQNIFETIEDFLKIDVNNLSISQAYDKITDFQERFRKLT